MAWTETKKQLPEDCEDVIVIISNINNDAIHLEIGHYDYSRKNWYGFEDYPIEDFGFFVSHWMLLPNKPE